MYESEDRLWGLYRERIAHEDALIQHRVSWFLGFSGLWLAAFAFVVHISTQVSIPQTIFRGYFLLLIPVVGFLMTLLVLLSLIGAAKAIRDVIDEWNAVPITDEARRRFPTIYSNGWARRLGQVGSLGICVVMLLAWAGVFLLVPSLA